MTKSKVLGRIERLVITKVLRKIVGLIKAKVLGWIVCLVCDRWDRWGVVWLIRLLILMRIFVTFSG